MKNYKFLKKGAFENLDKFEKRVNEETARGLRVINFTQDHGSIIVLLEK
ncbi:MAG: hypothetical protein AB8B73_08700 [Ekhidna sp.]